MVRKTKIKGIHLTLDEQDLEMLKTLMEYYGIDSHTQMIRMLIRWQMSNVVQYERQRKKILEKIEKFNVRGSQ